MKARRQLSMQKLNLRIAQSALTIAGGHYISLFHTAVCMCTHSFGSRGIILHCTTSHSSYRCAQGAGCCDRVILHQQPPALCQFPVEEQGQLASWGSVLSRHAGILQLVCCDLFHGGMRADAVSVRIRYLAYLAGVEIARTAFRDPMPILHQITSDADLVEYRTASDTEALCQCFTCGRWVPSAFLTAPRRKRYVSALPGGLQIALSLCSPPVIIAPTKLDTMWPMQMPIKLVTGAKAPSAEARLLRRHQRKLASGASLASSTQPAAVPGALQVALLGPAAFPLSRETLTHRMQMRQTKKRHLTDSCCLPVDRTCKCR